MKSDTKYSSLEERGFLWLLTLVCQVAWDSRRAAKVWQGEVIIPVHKNGRQDGMHYVPERDIVCPPCRRSHITIVHRGGWTPISRVCVVSPLLFIVYMNWTNSHNRVDQGVTVRSCWINRLLFVDDLVQLASSQQGLLHPLERFSVACDQTSTKKTEVSCPSRSSRHHTLQVSSSVRPEVEKFKYLGVVFTRDGKRNKKIGARIGKAKVILRELCRSVVTIREFSNTAKVSVFKSAFVPILTYGHKSWVMAEKVSDVHAAEMEFLWKIHGMTLCDHVRSCEIR